VRLATVTGRYYAMDRDNRWERIEGAYRALVNCPEFVASSGLEAIERAYGRGETDEFVKPTAIVEEFGEPIGSLLDGDSVVFFNGGREQVFDREDRCLVPSPRIATYDLQPEMSAPAVTASLLERLRARAIDFFLLNYANADMVGHTGIYEAAVKACKQVDSSV